MYFLKFKYLYLFTCRYLYSWWCMFKRTTFESRHYLNFWNVASVGVPYIGTVYAAQCRFINILYRILWSWRSLWTCSVSNCIDTLLYYRPTRCLLIINIFRYTSFNTRHENNYISYSFYSLHDNGITHFSILIIPRKR